VLKADEIRADEKEALRRRLRAERDSLSASEVLRASAHIVERVRALGAYERAGTVGLYASIGAEIDVRALLTGDKRLAFPRVSGHALHYHLVSSLEQLSPGNFTVPEPEKTAPLADSLDLIVVPAIAYDRTGHRVGYGKAFFDRALAERPSAVRVGVCHNLQLIDRVPIHDADQPVDFIITPSECIETGARKTSGAIR
jgi:5-formyltetrahydrofolate cyclo-ligase